MPAYQSEIIVIWLLYQMNSWDVCGKWVSYCASVGC